MRREVSSSVTGLYKCLTLVVYLVFMTVNLYNCLIEPASLQFFLTSMTMLLGYFIVRWILTWKKVEIAEKGIYVSGSNFGGEKEIFIPFERIETVSQTLLTRGTPDLVVVKFQSTTVFGDKIWFVAKTRLLHFFTHPVVDELNRLKMQSKKINPKKAASLGVDPSLKN